MPAINFRKEFAPMVESGVKRQSIRPCGKRRFKVGDTLYLYVGQRTKACRKLGEVKCIRVDSIRIWPDWKEVVVNDILLDLSQVDELAQLDGFRDRYAFFSFFREFGDDFDGQIISW